MSKLYSVLFLLLFVVLTIACSSSKNGVSHDEKELRILAKYMTGDFSSLAQHQRDSAYLDIRLHIRPIWPEKSGQHWLYVEQATAAAPTKPYRQRVYQLGADGKGGFSSTVYTLLTPEKWVGKYLHPEEFNALKESDLSLREGCSVYLKKQADGSFSGATQGTGCESTLRGAKYASSTVTIKPDRLLSWDQGFDANGVQVWGAKGSGYEFLKNSAD